MKRSKLTNNNVQVKELINPQEPLHDKNRENCCAILALRFIMVKILIIVPRCMFQNKPTAWFKQSLREYFARQLVNVGQGIRWTGKYKIVGCRSRMDKFKNVGLDHLEIGEPQRSRRRFDELIHLGVLFDDSDIRRSPAGKLIAYTPRATKKVEYGERTYVKIILNDVEKPFLGKIRGRPGIRHLLWRIYLSAAMCAPDYTHAAVANK